MDAKVHFYPPLTWIDFLAQETRYEMSMDQLFNKQPDLKIVYENRRKLLTSDQKQKIERLIDRKMAELRIDLNKRTLLHSVFGKIVEENAKYYLKDFLEKNGSWNPVSTTK